MRNILSLYDYSGAWPMPFSQAGHITHSLDLKSGFNVLDMDEAEEWLELFPDIDGIMAAVPCTDFALSGAQYWPAKDADGRTAASLELVMAVARLVDLYWPTDPDYDGSFFWVIENPVGRLTDLVPWLGKPCYFNPCDYAGHLGLSDSDHNELDRLRRKDGEGFCKEEVEFVMKCNAYTKKTGLWGRFNRKLPKAYIEPVRCGPQGSPVQFYGGDSEETKEARSNTPLGFARAFYMANVDWKPAKWDDPFYDSKQLSLF